MVKQLENRIARSIRQAINDNVMGRGPVVIGQDKNCTQQRIVNARVHKGMVQGKALNSSRWFQLSGWMLNTVNAKVSNIATEEQPSAVLTPLERRVLAALFESSKGNGHDFGFVEDCRSAVDKADQLGGVISSLSKKGLIYIDEPVRTDSGLWTQTTWRKSVEEIAALLTPVEEVSAPVETKQQTKANAPHHYDPPVSRHRRNSPCRVCGKTSRHSNHKVTPEYLSDAERIAIIMPVVDTDTMTCRWCGNAHHDHEQLVLVDHARWYAEEQEHLRRTEGVGETFTLQADCNLCGAKQGNEFVAVTGDQPHCAQCGSPSKIDRLFEQTKPGMVMAIAADILTKAIQYLALQETADSFHITDANFRLVELRSDVIGSLLTLHQANDLCVKGGR